MTRPFLLLSAALLFSPVLMAQQIKRELGDFDFTLGTTPSRSMAQGLISPSAVGAFHGGLDLSHPNGWYLGQYAPSMGVAPNSTLRLDSYLGYKHHFDSTLGYEMGLIHYSQPYTAGLDSHALPRSSPLQRRGASARAIPPSTTTHATSKRNDNGSPIRPTPPNAAITGTLSCRVAACCALTCLTTPYHTA